jgi:hypothetical protein
VAGDFDAAFAGFWWLHVRRQELVAFLTGLHRRLPGRDSASAVNGESRRSPCGQSGTEPECADHHWSYVQLEGTGGTDAVTIGPYTQRAKTTNGWWRRDRLRY